MNVLTKLLASALCGGLISIPLTNSYAQTNQSYPLPAPGYDIALTKDGTSVVSMRDSDTLWIRDAQKITRTTPFSSGPAKVQIKSDGSIAYLLGITVPHLYIFMLDSDSTSLRSFDALPVDFKLSPDEGRVIVGLDNKTSIVSDTTNFEDGAPISLSRIPQVITISPDSSSAYLGVGTSLVKVNLLTKQATQRIRTQGTVKGLAISPSGKLLYAITSRPSTKGAYAHVLTIIDTETRKVTASRTLTISGSEVATFDIEAGATSIFISSTQPVVIGTRKGGVVRVPVRKHRVGRPQFFALANIGAGAIAYNEPSRTLGILVPRDQSAQFRKTPRS